MRRYLLLAVVATVAACHGVPVLQSSGPDLDLLSAIALGISVGVAGVGTGFLLGVVWAIAQSDVAPANQGGHLAAGFVHEGRECED